MKLKTSLKAQKAEERKNANPTAHDTTINPPVNATRLCEEVTKGIVGFWYDEIRNHRAVHPRDLAPAFIKSTGIPFKAFWTYKEKKMFTHNRIVNLKREIPAMKQSTQTFVNS